MAKRNLFRQNPNQSRGGMIYGNNNNSGNDPRSKMLAQRDAERKRVAPRAAPTVASTYEGRQAQQQAYLQSVQQQKQQMEMQNAMRKPTMNNNNNKAIVFDQNAKAATNRAINETRNAKASREAMWEEKRKRHLATRQNGNDQYNQQPKIMQRQQQHMQMQQQQNRVSFAPPSQPQQRQQQPNPSRNYANQLEQQINDRKQLDLQNDISRRQTSNMAIGSNNVEDAAAKRKRQAQKDYANALKSQMEMQEQRKREEKEKQRQNTGLNNQMVNNNGSRMQQQTVPYDPILEEKRKRKQQYKQELDAQMRIKKQTEMQIRGGNGNDIPGGGALQVGGGRSQQQHANIPYDPNADEQRRRQMQYKQELDAQMRMKKQNEMKLNNVNNAGVGGGIMNQIGNNRQPYNGRRGRIDHFNTNEEEEKRRKKLEQQAYLQELDMQMKLKDERKKREKQAIQDEEKRFMAIGQKGVNNQKVSAQKEMFLMAGGINTNLSMPMQRGMQPQQMQQTSQQQIPPHQIPRQQMGMIQQQQRPMPQQMGMMQPQRQNGLLNNNIPSNMMSNNMMNANLRRSIPQNQQDHLNNHMGLLQQNNDSSAIYKHRFRDGIKDPAEIDALRERHVQQAKQNQLLAQQVADNKRRKEEAEMKRKAEEMAEEQRLRKEREELKKQYEDEIASQKAKKEAQQKAMLDEQIQKKRKQKEDEARRERERIRKENERIEKDRAEMAKQYERETGKSPPKQAQQGVQHTPPRSKPPISNSNSNTRPDMNNRRQNNSDNPNGKAMAVAGGGGHTARIKELEARLESAEKRALQNTRGQEVLNQRLNTSMKPPGSAPAPHPVTPKQSIRRSNQPGNETIRKEQASLLRKHDNMRAQMEKQMRLLKEMQVKLDVRESEASRYQQELSKLKGMVQAEKEKNSGLYLDDFVHAQEKALHAEIDDELTRLLEGGIGPNTPKQGNDSIDFSQFDTPKITSTFRQDSSGLTPQLIKTNGQNLQKSPDALDKYMNQNEHGRHALNESIPSQSKFVFPDGQTAPAPNVSVSARQGYQQQLQSSPVKLLNSPSPQKFHGLGGGINMSTDGQSLMDDSLNIDFVMNKNADKLNQLEQLGIQGEGGELHADQLDQMLVDFLNQNNGPHRNKSSDASALISPIHMHGGPRSGNVGRDLDLPPLKIQNLDDSFSGTLQGDSRFIGGAMSSRA